MLDSRRFVSMAARHHAAIEWTLVPEDWSGHVEVITAIDGTHVEDTSDVVRAIDRMSEDAEFTVEVVRDRKTQTLKGKLERRRDVNRTRTIV